MIPSLVGFGFSTPLSERTGYFKIQGTRPQTLSYGLTGSPAGRLRGSWRSSRGGPTPRCICLRMPCLAIIAGQRVGVLVHRHRRVVGQPLLRDTHDRTLPEPSGVPTGVAVFQADLAIRRHIERLFNITH